MKDINLRQDAPSQVSQVNPQKISEEIEKLQSVQQEIINKENEIKELKDGSEVSVGKKFYANARADKRADAYQWLRDNGLGDIIKNNISVTFGQGEENKAMAYANLAKEHGYEPSQKEDAHHASVSAVMKEWKEKGNEIPTDLFSVLDVDQVKIKNKS